MARRTGGLVARKIETLTKAGRYHDRDELYLQIQEGRNGIARSWLYRFQLDGRERWMGLGKATTFSLKEARERARKARQLVEDGVDPIDHRIAERDLRFKEARERLTFKQAADEFLNLHADGWKNDKHREQWRNTLADHAFPKLGNRPVATIDPALINEAVASIWTKTPETARRTRGRIERIIQWVKDGKPLPTKGNGKDHQPALPWEQVPEFMAELRKRQGVSARALELTILTAARTGDTLGAVWDEIDLDAKVWVVPAQRMKRPREQRYPLSDRAVEILRKLPREHGNPNVFIGNSQGDGLSERAMRQSLTGLHAARKLAGLPAWVDAKSGRLAVVHGFRSTFMDWAHETTSTPKTVMDMALAHLVKDQTEAAYRRGDLLEKRRPLMTKWAQYCASEPAEIADLAERRKAKA